MSGMGDSSYSDWEDSETGGQPCARGRHCAEADYQGNPKRGPRSFCDSDRNIIGSVIRGLPDVYVEVHYKLGKTGQSSQQDGRAQERISGGGKEAPVPLDLEIDAYLRHVLLVAGTWEDAVRAALGLSNPDTCPACRGEGETADGRDCQACAGRGLVKTRDGAALQRACELLAGQTREHQGHLSGLLALAPVEILRPVPKSRRIWEIPPGSVIRIDTAGDAWQRSEADGTAAGLEFLTLSSRTRGILGQNLKSRRVAVRCDGCDTIGTLKQREAEAGGWEPVVRCSACPQVYIGKPFELLMAREYQATVEAGKAS